MENKSAMLETQQAQPLTMKQRHGQAASQRNVGSRQAGRQAGRPSRHASKQRKAGKARNLQAREESEQESKKSMQRQNKETKKARKHAQEMNIVKGRKMHGQTKANANTVNQNTLFQPSPLSTKHCCYRHHHQHHHRRRGHRRAQGQKVKK